MKWILLLILYQGSGLTTAQVHGFPDRASCIAEGEIIREVLSKDRAPTRVSFRCIQPEIGR